MRAAPVLTLAAVLGLAGCTGSDDPGPTPAPTPASSCPVAADVPEVPAECVPDDTGFDATFAPPSGSAPAASSAIPPVTLPREPGDLAVGGNDTDPSKTTQTFTVTVPAGSRLRTTGVCQGPNLLQIAIAPQSAAAQEFACGQGEPAELTVEDGTAVTSATRYTVTVTSKAPSRWYVAIGATDTPAPPAPQ